MRRNNRDNKRTHVLWVTLLWKLRLDLLLEHFIYTAVGFEVTMKSSTEYMKQSLGFFLGLWCNFITQKKMVSLHSVSSEACELFVGWLLLSCVIQACKNRRRCLFLLVWHIVVVALKGCTGRLLLEILWWKQKLVGNSGVFPRGLH